MGREGWALRKATFSYKKEQNAYFSKTIKNKRKKKVKLSAQRLWAQDTDTPLLKNKGEKNGQVEAV